MGKTRPERAELPPWADEAVRQELSGIASNLHMALMVNNPPAMQETEETRVPSLGQEDPLEEGMAIHSRIFVWRIPWMEKPSGATVHRIAKSQKLLKRLSMHTHSATHCRITQKLQSLPSGCAPVPLGALAPGLLPLSLMGLSLRDSHPDPSGWVQILLDSGPVSKRPCVSTQKHACVCESQYGHHCASVQVCVRACVSARVAEREHPTDFCLRPQPRWVSCIHYPTRAR